MILCADPDDHGKNDSTLDGDRAALYGEAYLIRDGETIPLCRDNESVPLSKY